MIRINLANPKIRGGGVKPRRSPGSNRWNEQQALPGLDSPQVNRPRDPGGPRRSEGRRIFMYPDLIAFLRRYCGGIRS